MLCLCCWARAFSSCGERGLFFICSVRASHCGGFSRCGARALGTQASVVAARELSSCGSRALESTGSVVVAHGLSRSTACGIFPDQGSNPCPLPWQADSQPLRHQGSPIYFKIYFYSSVCEGASHCGFNLQFHHDY